MKTFFEVQKNLIGLNIVPGEFGFEMEVEGDNLIHLANASNNFIKYWLITEDHSLRDNSHEYVLRKPLNYNELLTALSILEKEFIDHKSIVYDSVRSSIHVHVNVLNLSMKEIYTYIILYYILEDTLLDFCGEDRIGNMFSLRVKDAEGVLWALFNALSTKDFGILYSDAFRYCSLNLVSLFKYGSLEFRGLKSTLDFNKIQIWVKTLLNLKNNIKNYNDIEKLLVDASVKGGKYILRSLVGDLYKEFYTDKVENNISNNVREIQDLIYLIDKNFDNSDIIHGYQKLKINKYPQEKIIRENFNMVLKEVF